MCLGFFWGHTSVGTTHTCIEITFSELHFRVCQIYKYHHHKHVFLDMNFLLSVFLLSFVTSGSPCTAIIWLGFLFTEIEYFIYRDCVLGD